MWKFCGKAQFPHSFRQFARNYAETVSFYKISTHGIFCSVMYVLFTPCVYGVCKSLVIPAAMRWRASPLLTVKNMLFDVTSDLIFEWKVWLIWPLSCCIKWLTKSSITCHWFRKLVDIEIIFMAVLRLILFEKPII